MSNDVVDQAAADELQLFVDNDEDLYRQQAQPILKNLALKMAKNVYKHELAVKLYEYLAVSGAKKYARKHGDGTPWNRMFGPATRRAAAQQWTRDFENEWAAGQYRELLPKKYRGVERQVPIGTRGPYLLPGPAHGTGSRHHYRGFDLIQLGEGDGYEVSVVRKGVREGLAADLAAARRLVDSMLGD